MSRSNTQLEEHKYTKTKDRHPLSTYLKAIFLLTITIVVMYLLITKIIVMFSRETNENTLIVIDFNIVPKEIQHYIFTLATTLLMGIYAVATFPLSGKKNKYLTGGGIAIVLFCAIYMIGYLGVYLQLNFSFLPEHVYISNQREGLQFFIGNLTFLMLLYASSFLFESEVD